MNTLTHTHTNTPIKTGAKVKVWSEKRKGRGKVPMGILKLYGFYLGFLIESIGMSPIFWEKKFFPIPYVCQKSIVFESFWLYIYSKCNPL
jgi:hypothetical protein